MIGKNQIPARFQKVIANEIDLFNAPQTVRDASKNPIPQKILKGKEPSWGNIPLVFCVFVDMVGSTKMSTELRNKTYARAYLLYVQTALKLFDKFKPDYINVHGDGVFAIFNRDSMYTALAAAITLIHFPGKSIHLSSNKLLTINLGLILVLTKAQ